MAPPGEMASALAEEVSELLQVLGLGGLHGAVDDLLLEGGEFSDAFAAKHEHLIHLRLGEGGLFATALDFDKVAILGEHEVAIDIGLGVLLVAEVEQGFVFPDAGADGGNLLFQRLLGDLAFVEQAIEGNGSGHAGTGDRGGAGAAIGLEDIAVDTEGALAELGQIHDGTKAAANETLDLDAAPIRATAGAVALFAVERGVGQHGVLGGEPAARHILHLHPAGNLILDGGRANNAGIAKGDEHGGVGVRGDVENEFDRTELVGTAAINAGHGPGIAVKEPGVKRASIKAEWATKDWAWADRQRWSARGVSAERRRP
jgi:hypothetical protein